MNRSGYIFRGIIGKGTYGTAYRCIGPDEKVCCVKKISLVDSSANATAKHSQMIQKEIYILTNLNHPRIIRFFSYFTVAKDRHIYIAMEYASNGALSSYLAERRSRLQYLEEDEVLTFLCDIAMGLEYLHLKRILHKDLKPENILICDANRLKISDFGVAGIVNRKKVNTDHQNFDGTPIYMAPEYLMNRQYSLMSDIWSLGCIFYELCMLKSPFACIREIEDLIFLVRHKMFKPMECKQRKYDESLKILCDEMMTIDPEQRIKIQQIVSHPLLMLRVYGNYFNYENIYSA